MPLLLARLPRLLNVINDSPQVFFCALFVLCLFFAMHWFLRVTPKKLLVNPFHTVEEKTAPKEEPGFLEGLKILLSSKYLLGIFGAVAFFELIATIFDYNFDLVAQATLGKGPELSAYQASYASWVTGITLICLLFGVSNITRFLGVRVALALVPLIMGVAIAGFLGYYGHLTFFFWLMAGSKAVNYALNGPALKQLYIPISQDARFKAQAWIETFGSRGAKGAGEVANLIMTPLRSGILGFAIVVLWFFNALFLGKTYDKAIKDKKLVC